MLTLGECEDFLVGAGLIENSSRTLHADHRPMHADVWAYRWMLDSGAIVEANRRSALTDQTWSDHIVSRTKPKAQPTFADAVERLVEAGRAQSESMRELQSQGYAWEQPERRFCACGQELREVLSKRRDSRCGDCRASVAKGETQLGEVVRPVSIDARIRDAREGRDEDPTTWTAGATPGWEWP